MELRPTRYGSRHLENLADIGGRNRFLCYIDRFFDQCPRREALIPFRSGGNNCLQDCTKDVKFLILVDRHAAYSIAR